MTVFLIRRLMQSAVVLFVVSVLVFLITPQAKFNLSSRWGMGGVLRAT